MSGFRPRFFLESQGPWPQEGELAGLGSDLSGSEWALGQEDSHHAVRVLRLGRGDPCEVVVGAAVYAATISDDRLPVKVRLATRLAGAEAGATYRTEVGVVQALSRPALIDHVLEKGTEVGAGFFILVQTAGSLPRPESHQDRLARWRRIVLEAAKQSKQTRVPTVEVATSLGQALETLRDGRTRPLVLEPSAPAAIWDKLGRGVTSQERVALFVGPEGGWSSEELEQFATARVEAVRLGQSILRTETAGPVAVALVRLLLWDW